MMKKILALLLALAMVLSLAACGNSKTDEDEKEGKTSQSEEVDENEEKETKKNKKDKNKDKDKDKDKSEKKDDGKTATKLEVDKVASFDVEDAYYTSCKGGIYYEVDDRYGLLSFDGKNDTGAKYYYVDDVEMYFAVVKSKPGNSIEDFNCFTLVDYKGEELIDGTYASYNVLSEKFVKVIEIDKEVENKDDALIYSNESGGFSIGPTEGDALYGGNWYIYNLETGEKVPGATGTKAYYSYAYGDIIKITPDTGYSKYINADGDEIDEDADVLDNGTYVITDDDGGTVYDAYGEKVFSYSEDDYDHVKYVNGRYVGSKYDSGKSKYFFLDEKGKKVGDEYDSTPYDYGNFIHAGEKLYTADGEEIFDGTYSVTVDKITNDYCIVATDTEYIIFDREGNELLNVEKDNEDLYVSTSNMAVSIEKGDDDYFYCFKNEDYTIKASATVTYFLVKNFNDDGTRALYDTLSGKVLLEDYKEYYAQECDGQIYILAKTTEDTVDVYLING